MKDCDIHLGALRAALEALDHKAMIRDKIAAVFATTPTAPAVDIGPMPFTQKELNAVWCDADISYGQRQKHLAEYVWDAALAEYRRQMEGACGHRSSAASSALDSGSPVATSGLEHSAASRMTDEELAEAYFGARGNFDVSVSGLRAVADAAVLALEAERSKA